MGVVVEHWSELAGQVPVGCLDDDAPIRRPILGELRPGQRTVLVRVGVDEQRPPGPGQPERQVHGRRRLPGAALEVSHGESHDHSVVVVVSSTLQS
ncbi:hypothetical protein Ae505Ps2_6294 [Pseudonocardia sp. Ae505_Ps2]|nr:hypothetical protein Ae505Ps2_6294 [Pseudonocardia sp. Ae505_Ps2]